MLACEYYNKHSFHAPLGSPWGPLNWICSTAALVQQPHYRRTNKFVTKKRADLRASNASITGGRLQQRVKTTLIFSIFVRVVNDPRLSELTVKVAVTESQYVLKN